MESIIDLKKLIKRELSSAKIDYGKLISYADKMIFHLLQRTSLLKSDIEFLAKFCTALLSYTRDSGTNSSKYSKDFKESTCDYKIAREMVVRFKNGGTYSNLRDWANNYYYDGVLWQAAIKQMIALDPIPGRVYAIEQSQPNHRETKEQVRNKHWKELKELRPTWEQIDKIAINTMMPIEFVKEVFGYVLAEKLLKTSPDEKYYLYLWKHTIKDAHSVTEHVELVEKHRSSLKKLAERVK